MNDQVKQLPNIELLQEYIELQQLSTILHERNMYIMRSDPPPKFRVLKEMEKVAGEIYRAEDGIIIDSITKEMIEAYRTALTKMATLIGQHPKYMLN